MTDPLKRAPTPTYAGQSRSAQSENLFNVQPPKTGAGLAGKEGSLLRFFLDADNQLNTWIFIMLVLTQH